MKKAKLFMMLALLVMGVSNLFAQNVTVHPGNGSMLPALKSTGGDTFFNWNGYATWKHEQLSLTLTTGDSNNNLTNSSNQLTEAKQLQNPANDIFASADGKCLQIGKGNAVTTGSGWSATTTYLDTYLTIALPKGYRFTGYTIKFHRISRPNGSPTGGNNPANDTEEDIEFGETNEAFSYKNIDKTYYGGIARNSTTPYTLTRTADDMDNVLYFKLSNGRKSGRAFIQLDQVELYFTAENDYTVLVPPTSVRGKTAVDVEFNTSKIDYGTLTKRTDSGGSGFNYWSKTRISYNGTVHDLKASVTLYEDGSVTEDKDNGFDGTVGKMVAYLDNGSITSEADWFRLDATAHQNPEETGEAIYFLESPIWAVNKSSSSGFKYPIGYRIVGAKFDYAAGTASTYIPATFCIRYEDEGVTYGLNEYNCRFNLNYQTAWRIDEEGYIYYGEKYLSVDDDNFVKIVTEKSNASTFEISDGKILIMNSTDQYIGWQETTIVETGEDGEEKTITIWIPVITNDESHICYYDEQTPSGGGSTGRYTLRIYDKTGTEVLEERIVEGNGGSVTVEGYNNDAIKIGIVGVARIKASLVMQALDPYIDRLNIVCQENNGTGGRLTQQFNSTDFSVKGGKFTFYVPEKFEAPAKFTFENLYSQYGDNDYYEANNNPENHARYFFVGSDYGDYNDNVYDRYKNHSDAKYTTKIDCKKPGDRKHLFNNAETVADPNGNGGEFEEYPFNKAIYKDKNGAKGNFIDFTFNKTEMENGTTKIAYLFTCDETKYNIAPTTATQHVFYAYYEMEIDMQKKDYRPKFDWTKIYEETFYRTDDNVIKRKEPKWGLTVTTTETVDDNGTHSGYLTVSGILDAITNGLPATVAQGNTPAQPAVQGLDATGVNAPKSMDQILYVDASDLMSIVENPTATSTNTLRDLKNNLDKNALIYMPYGSKPSGDNFAYNTVPDYEETPRSYRAADNIEIYDSYPFFAPYDIQVDPAKMAKYERKLTNEALYGDDDQHLTIVLPFEIGVVDGIHTNKDNKGKPFMLSTMKTTNALSKKAGSQIDFYKDGADGYFTKITGEKSEANKPYVVTMQGGTESSFMVHQEGSLVKATPSTPSITGILTGESATGDYAYKENNVEKTAHYSFTHEGTYTGVEIGEDGKGGAAKASTTVFYFANNYFLDSKTLINEKSLKMLPFRSYYDYTESGAGAKMARFRIVFGENNDMGDTNGINEIQRDADLAVIPGDGSITLMARADKDVTIHAVSGITVDKCSLRAGETRTVSVPAGVYVINGVKMVVK